MKLVVRRTTEIAEGVRELALAHPDGRPLTSHPAGSHVVVDRNAYSLTNYGANPAEYTIAVLRREGYSATLHAYSPGELVDVSRPRCTFAPVATARKHLLIAGGIGITPMVAHVRDALRWQRPVELLYVHREGPGPYATELERSLGQRLQRTTDRQVFLDKLAGMLTTQPLGTHLYVCGPGPLMDDVLSRAASTGWPPQRLHFERFVPAALDPGREFVARLARSGRDVVVPAGVSLLDALREAGIDVPSLCRNGICGECRVPVLAGQPLHRDEYLADDERSTAVMCCVSRSETDALELDL